MPGKGVITRTGFAGRRDEGIGGGRAHGGSQPGRRLGIKDDVFEKKDIHIHVPDGATPKDGPALALP
jgi:ATP-dependent Lon protease